MALATVAILTLLTGVASPGGIIPGLGGGGGSSTPASSTRHQGTVASYALSSGGAAVAATADAPAADADAAGAVAATSATAATAATGSDGGGGALVVTCNGLTVTIEGTPGADVIDGTPGNDVIAGLGGNDIIAGNGGNDTICGGAGNDIVNGDDGDDTLLGDAGDDIMNGDDGNDVIDGGDGDDNLGGRNGDDTMSGGEGADIMSGHGGNDTMYGDGGNDNMNGGQDDDFMDGGAGDDLMSGSTGDDTLLGRSGADVLNGGPQFDTCDLGPDGLSQSKCENGRPQADDQSETVQEDGPAISPAYATVDPDPTTYALVGSAPAKGTLVVDNGNGTFTYDPNGDFEDLPAGGSEIVSFDYEATDSNGATSDVATVTITVEGNNDAPVAQDVAVAADEDGPAVVGNFDADDVDTDDNPLTLTYTILTSPSEGSVANNGDGTFTFDPEDDFQDLDDGETRVVTFDYKATDSNPADSNTATVTVTVTGVDDEVTAIDDSYDADEDNVLNVAAPGVLGNDDDPDGDATAVPIVNGQGALGGGVNLAADGSLSYDPDGNFEFLAVGESAVDTFTYTAQNTISSSDATVSITVNGVNDDPTANSGGADGTGTFVITVSGTDPDLSDDLEVTAASATLGTVGTITNFDGGAPGFEDKNTAEITYTAPAGNPEDTLTFTMDDDNGGTSVGTITINQDPGTEPPEDPPPVDGIDAKDASVETSGAVDLVLRAAAPADIGDLTFSLVTGPPASEGSLSAIVDQTPPPAVRSATTTFTPASGFTGTTSFVFEACEVASPTNCDQATVTISVEAAAAPVDPMAPVVNDVSKTLEESATLGFSLAEGVESIGTNEECDDPGDPCGRLAVAQSDKFDSVGDPAGDATAGEPDLVSMEVGVTAALNNVAFDVRFDSGSFNAATSRATVVIDSDRNPATGFPGIDAANNDDDVIGTEYLIEIGADAGANAEIKEWVSGNTFTTVAVVPATVFADGYHVAFSLNLLGGDEGHFSYKVVTQRHLGGGGFTGIQDYMPDVGAGIGDISPDANFVATPLSYRLLTLPSSGTLFDSEGTAITSVPVDLFSPLVSYEAAASIGSFSFDFQVRNTALISTQSTVVLNVVALGTCEDDAAFCDDGR